MAKAFASYAHRMTHELFVMESVLDDIIWIYRTYDTARMCASHFKSWTEEYFCADNWAPLNEWWIKPSHVVLFVCGLLQIMTMKNRIQVQMRADCWRKKFIQSRLSNFSIKSNPFAYFLCTRHGFNDRFASKSVVRFGCVVLKNNQNYFSSVLKNFELWFTFRTIWTPNKIE